MARVIHDSGPRASGPFVEVNCAAIPETMLEAELFGFEPGAFTDAKRAKPGLFEAASEGRRFWTRSTRCRWCSKANCSPPLRPSTCAVWGPYGRTRWTSSSSLPLMLVCLSTLRQDGSGPTCITGWRWSSWHCRPCASAVQDVLVLAEAFIQQYTTAHGVPPKRLNAAAAAWLRGYAWPGNVRELSHVMERVALLHVGEEVDADHAD